MSVFSIKKNSQQLLAIGPVSGSCFSQFLIIAFLLALLTLLYNIMLLLCHCRKEIQLMHKELEVLSVQHTQRCLENSQLSQELQDERQALMQYQKENQELKKKQV